MCDVLLQNIYGIDRVNVIFDCHETFRKDKRSKIVYKSDEEIIYNILEKIKITGDCMNLIKHILAYFPSCFQFFVDEYEE